VTLVSDCVNYVFSEEEALAYIKARLGRQISTDAYYKRKRLVDSGMYTKEWMCHYSKVRFLVKHKQILQVMDTVQQDTMRDYIIEE
jgi:hypothetical protein